MQGESETKAAAATNVTGNLTFFAGLSEASDTDAFMGTASFLKHAQIPDFASSIPSFWLSGCWTAEVSPSTLVASGCCRLFKLNLEKR